jgi:predicted DNA-binding transcriptional regulator AlpA
MGLREIEKRLGISRQRAHQLTEHQRFPPAYDVIKAGRIWKTEDVDRWIAENRPEKTTSDVP